MIQKSKEEDDFDDWWLKSFWKDVTSLQANKIVAFVIFSKSLFPQKSNCAIHLIYFTNSFNYNQ